MWGLQELVDIVFFVFCSDRRRPKFGDSPICSVACRQLMRELPHRLRLALAHLEWKLTASCWRACVTWTADAFGGLGLRTRTVVVHQETRSILLIKETEGHRGTPARILDSNIAETEQRPGSWTVAAAPIASTLWWLAWCSSFLRCQSQARSRKCWWRSRF